MENEISVASLIISIIILIVVILIIIFICYSNNDNDNSNQLKNANKDNFYGSDGCTMFKFGCCCTHNGNPGMCDTSAKCATGRSDAMGCHDC